MINRAQLLDRLAVDGQPTNTITVVFHGYARSSFCLPAVAAKTGANGDDFLIVVEDPAHPHAPPQSPLTQQQLALLLRQAGPGRHRLLVVFHGYEQASFCLPLTDAYEGANLTDFLLIVEDPDRPAR